MISIGMVILAQYDEEELANNQSFLTGMSLSSLDVFKAGGILGLPQPGSQSPRRLNPYSCEHLFSSSIPASQEISHCLPGPAKKTKTKKPLCWPAKGSNSVTAKPALFAQAEPLCFLPAHGRQEGKPQHGWGRGARLMLCRPV